MEKIAMAPLYREGTSIPRRVDSTRIHRRTDYARFKAVKPDEWIRL